MYVYLEHNKHTGNCYPGLLCGNNFSSLQRAVRL